MYCINNLIIEPDLNIGGAHKPNLITGSLFVLAFQLSQAKLEKFREAMMQLTANQSGCLEAVIRWTQDKF